MSRVWLALTLFLIFIPSITSQGIPQELRGKWRVSRILPAQTVSCWDAKEAKGLIGTEIEYTTDSFRWKDKTISHPSVEVAVVTAEEFQKEYSGSGSFVSFGVLGIPGSKTTRIKINHAAADITHGSIEIPGDDVLMKDGNTIVFSVCNVYFQGNRERPR
jgi:hypothetical protein